ncbi:MAG: peroxidase [Modestobacter sp.]|nr:peroxidase [Modestobacter sp.]
MTQLEREDVQGLVFSGYAAMHEARYLFYEVADPAGARRWLGELAARVTTGSAGEGAHCTNVALTHRGLAALGLDPEPLSTFAPPFQEGMTTPYRQRVLGDVGPSAPDMWAWGGPPGSDSSAPEDRLHVLLLLFAPDGGAMDSLLDAEMSRATGEGALRHLQTLQPEPLPGTISAGKFGVEHFGFADGMSQPVIQGTGQEDELAGEQARRHVVATGEFVLGYPNGYGELTPSPWLPGPDSGKVDLGRNGTYLVVRQLKQDVHGFRELVRRLAGTVGDDADAEARFAAKLVGRWYSGAPLARTPHRDDVDLATDNAFGYAEVDPYGERCPLGAHIRRANPRDSTAPERARALELTNLHRILRRGRVYGPGLPDAATEDDLVERGLIFICMSANIERQFEFVQQTWCNNPKFSGLYEEQDPVLGTPPPEGGLFTVQGSPFATRARGLTNFVTVRGGAYFFLPGVRGLLSLAGRS